MTKTAVASHGVAFRRVGGLQQQRVIRGLERFEVSSSPVLLDLCCPRSDGWRGRVDTNGGSGAEDCREQAGQFELLQSKLNMQSCMFSLRGAIKDNDQVNPAVASQKQSNEERLLILTKHKMGKDHHGRPIPYLEEKC